MKTFLTYILESSKDFSKTIALVGGSFKFPTIAHWHMIQEYAKKADEVVVIVSDPKSPKSIRKTSNGTVITADMAKDIFDIYINKYGLKDKVKAIVSPEPSPITAAFKYIDDNIEDANVILGVSKKGGDESRFKSAEKYYADNDHIHLIDPMKTAVEPYVDKDGYPISATDARNSLDNPEALKKYLPEKLSDNDIKKVLEILKVKPTTESKELSKVDLKPLDETECIHIDINDDILNSSKILCYNASQTVTDPKGKEIPVNPKKFPTKAVIVRFEVDGTLISIYFDTKTKCWNSTFKYDGKHGCLSPDQFESFFNSLFYQKLLNKLQKIWPLSDTFHKELYDGIANKLLWLSYDPNLEEANDEDTEKEQLKFSASGRKIMNFTDNGVSSKGAKFFCWPDINKLDKWSTWKDWKKIKPLCKLRIKYKNNHEYTMTLSVVGEDYKNRGFRAIDITETPPVQWLSKNENEDFIKLSIVDKFIRHCSEKIGKYVAMDPEEIYANINNPEKISVEEIRNTLNKIRNTLNEIIKKHQTDSFKWR